MINGIPIIGWALSFIISVCLAIPFYFLWNHMAPVYLYWWPNLYLSLPFWDCVWLFMLVSILKTWFPKIVSVAQTNNK